MDGYGIATFDVSEAIFLGSPTTVLFRRLVTSAQWFLVTRPLNPLVWIGSRVEADCMVEEQVFFFFFIKMRNLFLCPFPLFSRMILCIVFELNGERCVGENHLIKLL